MTGDGGIIWQSKLKIFLIFQSLLVIIQLIWHLAIKVGKTQCAIRMSIALVNLGVHLVGYKDPLCKHGHARGAESLANYLWKQFGKPVIFNNAVTARARTFAKTGIVFFRNITGFRAGQGDHIDLWNFNSASTGAYFEASAEIWFWEIC